MKVSTSEGRRDRGTETRVEFESANTERTEPPSVCQRGRGKRGGVGVGGRIQD